MSTFNALNLTPHDEQLEAEEHSRELEIEECFKVFQSALFELKAKRFDNANAKFEELLKRDVIKPNKWGFYYYSSPTLDRLRYLTYRNRGMYHYSYLQENQSTMSSQDIVDCILKVVENLLESIQHNEADSSVTELLIQIFQSYKSKRLERMVLEYELTRSENTLLLVGRKRKSILPKQQLIINQFRDLLENIKDNESHVGFFQSLPRLKEQPRLSSILLRIRDMKTQDEHTMKELDVFEITLQSFTWEALANSLKDLLPHTKISNLLNKSFDPYADVPEPIEAIRFVLDATENTEVNTDAKKIAEVAEIEEEAPSADSSKEPKVAELNSVKNVSEEHNISKRPIEHADAPKPVQRSSKRFKDKDQDLVENDLLNTTHVAFMEELANLSEMLGLRVKLNQWKSLLDGQLQDDLTFLPYRDLLECLKGWSSWHTDIFTQNDSSSSGNNQNDEETLQLNALLKSNVFADKDNDANLDDLPEERLMSFISTVNKHATHFQEARFKFLKLLLSLDTDQRTRLIVDCSWSRSLFEAVEWLFLSTEQNLFEFVSSNSDICPYFALSFYELLVNMMGNICEQISSKKLQGHRTHELKTQKNKLEVKHERWLELLKNYENPNRIWQIYFQWAHYCFLQYTCEVFDDRIPSTLILIEKMLRESDEPIDIVYPNYRYILRLNLSALDSQIRKINIIRRIGIVDVSNEDTSTDDADQNMEILERILLESVHPAKELSDDDQEMLSFIKNSPFLLKLKLWEALFSYYIRNHNTHSSLSCYFYVLKMLDDILTSEKYSQQSEKQRQQMLLTSLITVGNLTSKFIKLLSFNNWDDIEEIKENNERLQLLLNFFLLFDSVLIFEARKDIFNKSFFQKATKSSARLKDAIANVTTLLTYFFNLHVSHKYPDQHGYLISNFIWCTHSLLGSFGFCDASNGNFLRLSEHLLCQFINQESLIQLKQIIWCRYHYLIAGDNFTPDQHPTKAIEMDKRNSLPLGIYLIKLQYQGKNPLLASGNKASLKPVLDNIIDLVGDPESLGNYIVARNKYLVEEYLEMPLTATLLKKAFRGQGQLDLTTPNDELQEATDAGLFYVSSIQAFNLYRFRKKSMQARPSELDYIVAMLKNDIIYNTQRFESWYLLGRCFAFMVEDDLIWTSDKLSVPEKKSSTAQTQKQAILCYIMSVAVYFARPCNSAEDGPIIQRILGALGLEMMSGYLKPMEKQCYFGAPWAQWMKLNENGELIKQTTANVRTISDFNVEQAILLSLQQAIRFCDHSDFTDTANSFKWIYRYNSGHFLFKIARLDHGLTACENILQSCKIACKISSQKDPIIEPHYSFVNTCYKLLKLGVLSPLKALEMLQKDKDFFEEDEHFWELDISLAVDYQRKVVFQKVINMLRYLLTADKKKWHHRPRYRIAKILFEDFDDPSAALDEMESVMSVKSAHKNLVNIWKPDFERPGKHFVYTYQYVMFYLDLLFCKRDFNSIGRVCKKIRRFGSGMAYVNKATEHALMLYTQCTRAKLQLDEKECIEHLLPSLNYQTFLIVSEDLQNTFTEANYSEELLCGLKISYQLKKGNNGIAFDGICISIYFKYFYLPIAPANTEQDVLSGGQEQDQYDNTESQSQTAERHFKAGSLTPSQIAGGSSSNKYTVPRKRVSKKDVFDKIRVLIEKITCN